MIIITIFYSNTLGTTQHKNSERSINTREFCFLQHAKQKRFLQQFWFTSYTQRKKILEDPTYHRNTMAVMTHSIHIVCLPQSLRHHVTSEGRSSLALSKRGVHSFHGLSKQGHFRSSRIYYVKHTARNLDMSCQKLPVIEQHVEKKGVRFAWRKCEAELSLARLALHFLQTRLERCASEKNVCRNSFPGILIRWGIFF